MSLSRSIYLMILKENEFSETPWFFSQFSVNNIVWIIIINTVLISNFLLYKEHHYFIVSPLFLLIFLVWNSLEHSLIRWWNTAFIKFVLISALLKYDLLSWYCHAIEYIKQLKLKRIRTKNIKNDLQQFFWDV